MLVSAAIVDNYLGELFATIRPRVMGSSQFKKLAQYPGALSSFSARSDVALATRLIGADTHRAISHLRKLRNEVAHSPDEFRLAAHLDRVREVHKLGEGIPQAINQMAVESLVKGVLKDLWEKDQARPESERFFESPDDVLDAVSNHRDGLEILQEKTHRLELALAVTLLCGGIVARRESIVRRYPDNELV